MRIILLMILLCGLPAVASAQTNTDLIGLHLNTAAGEPDPTITNRDITVRGIVTCPRGVFSNSEITLQDTTAGLTMFGVLTINGQIGDEVLMTGRVTQFNGLTELSNFTVMTTVSQNNPLPEPRILTCQQAANSFDPVTRREINEGRLVRLKQVMYQFTSPSGSNKIGSLTDATGTCTIFLDNDAGLIEPPTGVPLDVIGILKQFDNSSPYTSGYQIVPRFAADFVYSSGPQVLVPPVETAITPTQITLRWETTEACQTMLQYGLTENFELGIAQSTNLTTQHTHTLTGLTSATVYYVRAIAKNVAVTNYGPTQAVVTASANSPGTIDVYFSKEVKTAYANGDSAKSVNLAVEIARLINAAQHSIDFCFYNITLQDDVARPLIAAHNRGVRVRVIHEQDNANSSTQLLASSGIPVIHDGRTQHLMHNKFVVFDYGDGNEANDVVWTGSWNATITGTTYSAENAVVIRDASLAAAYALEFAEMWRGQFSAAKRNNTPHRFNIGGVWVEQYMSPSDALDRALEQTIRTGQHDLFFCIYNFTLNNVSSVMRGQFNAGAKVRGVFDAEESAFGASEWGWMSTWADVHQDKVEPTSSNALLHHKYLLVDPLRPDSDPTVVTGSYNWTAAATEDHDENMLIIHSPRVANLFFQEFMARYHEAGGQWDYLGIEDEPESAAASRLELRQSYPNPLRQGLSAAISYKLPEAGPVGLAIYNTAGQLVRRLVNVQQSAGDQQTHWDGRNEIGHPAAPGVYLYQLEAGGEKILKRLVLID